VLELKAQISKKLIFITPYLGAAAALSFGSSASGSVESTMTYNSHTLNQNDINLINAYYASQGQTPPDLSSVGIKASASSGAGLDFRAFGGLSFDLFILYLDLGGAYDISTGAFGADLNVRLAL
jgi:hypothetical protein